MSDDDFATQLGIDLIKKIYRHTKGWSGSDSFAFRLNFYVRMLATDLVTHAPSEKWDEFIEAIAIDLNQTVSQFKDKEKLH